MQTSKYRVPGPREPLFPGWPVLLAALCLSAFLTNRCVYPYNPKIDEIQEMLVIDGHIIKGEKVQTIHISRSSAYNNPRSLPESGCWVRVVDNKGRQFEFRETSKGTYSAEIPDAQITFNTTYQLFVTTPDNKNYESSPELLLRDTPVDSLYYFEEKGQSAASGSMDGIRFYIDLKAKEGNATNYRWILEETWEFHRKFPREIWFNGDTKKTIKLPVNADSLVVCYITSAVDGFYSSSTANLQVNEKKRIPLNYVSNHSPRLERKYSMLVRQYSLSDEAYIYFNTKKMEIQESGGLYQIQPAQTTSNLINSDDPAEKVLGYFWASSYSEKRIFAKPPFDFVIDSYCLPHSIDWEAISYAEKYPSFYITVIDGIQLTAEDQCFDCTQSGGVMKTPAFWK